MMPLSQTMSPRRVFMILSPRALAYARHALESLLANSLESLRLHLITDSDSDKLLLVEELHRYPLERHTLEVFAKTDLDDQEATVFGNYPNLREFRQGHPCWRKITDPLLLSSDEQEMVMLDPDLYFPNRFCFEKTPDRSLLLMWQGPSCLLPTAIVDTAIAKRIALAHHVDIGVAQWRAPVDLDWLEWLLGQLNLANHPDARFSMHVEAIVWSAIAMRIGGGYLSPNYWHCWRRSQLVRLLRKLHVPGPQLLRTEPFASIKCFHGGGEAKHWLDAARQRGWLDSGKVLDQPGKIDPFVELTRSVYNRDQTIKLWLRKLGYYNLFPSGALQ
jgi:hypothetical protein